MTPKQSIFIILVGIFFLILVIALIQKNRIRIRYSILWVGISLFFMTIPLFIDFYTAVGELVGIVNYISLFFFGAIIGLFLLSIQFTLALSISFNQRKSAIQKTALLEERILKLEKKLAEKSSDQ
jgi:hypothetical protein